MENHGTLITSCSQFQMLLCIPSESSSPPPLSHHLLLLFFVVCIYFFLKQLCCWVCCCSHDSKCTLLIDDGRFRSQEEVVAVVKACARYKVCFSHTLLYLICSFASSVIQDSDCIELQHWVVPNQRSIQTVVCE